MLRELLQIFAYELSRPIRPSDHEIEYVGTQFISEYFRDHDFSGILYPSAVASGINAVFFDPKIATKTGCVQKVVWSKSVEVVDAQAFERRGR